MKVFNPADPDQSYCLVYPGYVHEGGEQEAVEERIVHAGTFDQLNRMWRVWVSQPKYVVGFTEQKEPRFYDLNYMMIRRQRKEPMLEEEPPRVTLAEFLIQASAHGKHWDWLTIQAIELMAGRFSVRFK